MLSTTVSAAKSVIVAGDAAFVRDRFKTALEGAGYRASTVVTGTDLMALVRDHAGDVDLVVLDLRLPDTSGLDLVRNLCGIEGFRAPIVIFSGTIANAAEVRELSALGVSGYVNEYTAVEHIVPSLAPHLFPDHHNRRGGPRVVLGIPVAYRLGNTIAAALMLNIGQSGLAIRTTSPLEQGATVRVRFRLPGHKKDVDAEARVAWVDRRTGMGLQFTRLDAPDHESIDEFVHAYFFSNRKA